MSYFVEVTKVSGTKTYYGINYRETYKPKELLLESDGFSTKRESLVAQERVRENCESMGIFVSTINIICIGQEEPLEDKSLLSDDKQNIEEVKDETNKITKPKRIKLNLKL